MLNNNLRGTLLRTALLALTAITFPNKGRSDQQAGAAVGSTITVTVFTDGTQPFTYVWSKNGTPIGGATSSSYTITNAQVSDTGNYTAVVTNGLGSTMSDIASVAVGVAPNISVNPAPSQTVSAGSTVSFSVVATGLPSPTYQWQKGGVNLTDGGIISGSLTSTLTLTGVAVADSGTYSVIVSDGIAPDATSTNSVLTVNGAAPLITTQPVTQLVGTNSTVTFISTASGIPSPTFQWAMNNVPIPGATGSILTLLNVTAANDGNYSVTAMNPLGSSSSTTATLTVSSTAPTVTSAASGSTLEGTPYSYTIVATNSPTSYSATGLPAGLTLNTATGVVSGIPTTPGVYTSYLVATNGVGNSTLPFVLTVNLSTPVISVAGPVSDPEFVPFTYSISATNGPISYGATGLPPGLTLNTTTGLISGEPTQTGTFNVGLSATNAGATGTATLILNVIQVNYFGTYFGTFGSGGNWALSVSSNNSGEFISNVGGTQTVQNVIVNSQGYFVVSSSGTSIATGSVVPRATVTTAYPYDINIINGHVSGTAGADVLSGDQDTAGGSPVPAGYYAESALDDSPGGAYAVVGADGRIYSLFLSGSIVDSISGTLNSGGSLTSPSAGGGTVQISASSNGQLSETLTPAGTSTPIKFYGTDVYVASATRLINLSARANVGSGQNVLIAGFTVSGSTKSILLRGIGPTLSQFLSGNLSSPQISLFSGASILQSNTTWGGSAALTSAFSQVGAFALSPTSSDSALLISLAAGNYTSQVSGVGSSTGIALAEIYDSDTGNSPAGRLRNLSARAQVGTGSNALIAGFVVAGNSTETVVIRAVGPTLATYNVSGVLSNPQLVLLDASGNKLASNTVWGGSAALTSAFAQAGAFPLPASSSDSALLVTLSPGSYTAEVTPASGSGGLALVEIYEVQ